MMNVKDIKAFAQKHGLVGARCPGCKNAFSYIVLFAVDEEFHSIEELEEKGAPCPVCQEKLTVVVR